MKEAGVDLESEGSGVRKDRVLQSIFDRVKNPIDSLNFKCSILGIYALPQMWKTKVK
jgi:hypothetical protein